MKLSGFSRTVVSAVLLLSAIIETDACGPYNPIIPTPEFFGLTKSHKTMADYEKEENLKLWQSLTSPRIPISDIEDVVYRASRDQLYSAGHDSDNKLLIYLKNASDEELVAFLETAKRLEERWNKFRSPWYYPRSKEYGEEGGDFSDIIGQCRAYAGTRLKDRYALQVSRALFASRQYAACIEFSDSAFADIPDTNLMKCMAGRYAAGCWSRLGQTRRADSLFAKTGDVWSITAHNPVELMSRLNPGAPQLMDYIRTHASDSLFMLGVQPLALRLAASHEAGNRGDWNLLMAYISSEYNRNLPAARKFIGRAMRLLFSSDELKDIARAYKMKLDGQAGDTRSLLADLKWMASKADMLDPEAEEWIRRCRNIIYVDWVPGLWKKKDFTTAILLCAYADNLVPSGRDNAHSLKMAEMRNCEENYNSLDYGCLSFQLMGSLSSAQLASAYAGITSESPLHSFLRNYARTDRDYYYELIGTIALREENYSRAERYLSKVDEHYLRTTNIDKHGYLSRDPFVPYASRWTTEYMQDEDAETWEWERAAANHIHKSNPGAKLEFARRMKALQQRISHGRTPDERGLARLMYAIGRRNSFEECWALTQYWRGDCMMFTPILQYWEEGFAERQYDFLFDYEKSIGHHTTERIYSEEVKAALAMLSTDEARAKAHFCLNNLATVVRCYGQTATALHIKASCDNWESWL